MRIARIAGDEGPRPVVQHGRYWREVVDPFAADLTYTGLDHPVDGARLLAPVEPAVVVGLTHSGSRDGRPPQPQAFTKSARTVTGPGGAVTVDEDLGQVNGATIAAASTGQLAWTVAEQLAYLTRYMRLGPGDVVLTGCPGTFAPVKPGDQAVVAIDGIGELSNPIRTSR
jgi:hypothetical protein